MRGTSSVGLVVLVTITAALVVALHQLGEVTSHCVDWSDPIGWVTTARAEEVASGCARQIGLAIGYWVLGTVAICVLSRGPHRPRWVTVLTLPRVRRVVDRALAATVVASIAATSLPPAFADSSPPIVSEAAVDGIPVPHVTMTRIREPLADEPVAEPARLPIAIPPPSVESNTVRGEVVHTVRRGDNLWLIAANHLAAELGEIPDPGRVNEYWRLVIATNRPTLRSGDPDLIYPGEVLSLPAVRVSR